MTTHCFHQAPLYNHHLRFIVARRETLQLDKNTLSVRMAKWGSSSEFNDWIRAQAARILILYGECGFGREQTIERKTKRNLRSRGELPH